MGEKRCYWTLVKLDPAGGRRVNELPDVKEFFQQHIDLTLEQDTVIQKHLIELARSEIETHDRTLAELCLRCFISHQIEQACIQLESQFGEYYGFTRYDLLALVLDDEGEGTRQKKQSTYQLLSVKILEKFDPAYASLSTWTTRLVKQHHELNAFLLEQGLCMLSDWAILNDTKPKKLHRVLTQFHQLTESEVEQAILLLESYHAVYRRDRLLQGQKGTCSPPTIAQLQEIGDRLQQQTSRPIPPDAILIRLTVLADRLRQYRISVGGGKPPSQSLDQADTSLLDEVSQHSSNPGDDLQIEFLTTYRQQFLGCLENALQRVVNDHLQTLKPPKQQQFLTALTLFHCQKLAMSEIARQIGLKAQYQVTRLLKLDELRTDVRHWMLQCLRKSVKSTVLNYVEPDKLDKIDYQIAVALEEQVDHLIQQEQASSKTPKGYVSNSLFAQRLCKYLDEIIADSF